MFAEGEGGGGVGVGGWKKMNGLVLQVLPVLPPVV